MHILVAIAFILIIASMVSALYFMMHDKGKTKRMVWSLATRVGLVDLAVPVHPVRALDGLDSVDRYSVRALSAARRIRAPP